MKITHEQRMEMNWVYSGAGLVTQDEKDEYAPLIYIVPYTYATNISQDIKYNMPIEFFKIDRNNINVNL